MDPKSFTCEICGSTFTANCVIAKYCGPECRQAGWVIKYAARRRKQAAEVYPVRKICQNCEKPFEAATGAPRHCTEVCRREGLRKTRARWNKKVGYAIRQGVEIKRNCRHCGEEFTVKFYRRTYCKDSCRESYKVSNGSKSS